MKSLITRNKAIRLGEYTIRGTRINVTVIKGMHKAGDSIELLMNAYNLSREQVTACINFNTRKKHFNIFSKIALPLPGQATSSKASTTKLQSSRLLDKAN